MNVDGNDRAEQPEVRHVPFNPTPLGMHSPLAAICDEHERGGWRLVQVVPHHQYESVAVFVREAVDVGR